MGAQKSEFSGSGGGCEGEHQLRGFGALEVGNMTYMGWALVGARRICSSTHPRERMQHQAQRSPLPARNRRLTAIYVYLCSLLSWGAIARPSICFRVSRWEDTVAVSPPTSHGKRDPRHGRSDPLVVYHGNRAQQATHPRITSPTDFITSLRYQLKAVCF